MYVETVITIDNKKRYMLVDDDGELVIPVNRFLKFKDNAGKARNTLRGYCYHLSSFFDFLQQKTLDYKNVSLDDVAEYMRWLQNPYRDVKITSFSGNKKILKNSTINTYISTVTEFYEYIMRLDDPSMKLNFKLKKSMLNSRKGYKDFLYHINKDKIFDAKYLKLKEGKKVKQPITNEDIINLMNACCNKRDYFLLHLLWESGFRIGECLSLWLEDFIIHARKIDLKDRGELINGSEIKTVTSPRKIDVSEDLINDYLDYIAEYHTDVIDTNFVFFKLSGKNNGNPLEYQDVDSLFKRLRKKTGIDVTPHIFRHTHFDTLRQQEGWDWVKIQKRGGWSNVQTPMQVYSHPSDEEMHDDWKKAEKNMKINKKG
jgi:integrase